MDENKIHRLAQDVSSLLSHHKINAYSCSLIIKLPREPYESDRWIFEVPVDHKNIISVVKFMLSD